MLEETNEFENAETPTAEEKVEETIDETVKETEEEIGKEEGIEFTDTEATEEVEEKEEQVEVLPKPEVNRIVESRLARERRKYAEHEEIINILKAGLGQENVAEIKQSLKDFYTKQGIEIPKTNLINERDEIILAKADAQEIIDAGEEEMLDEVNRITSIPFEKRSVRERTILTEVGNELILLRAGKELEKRGVEASILKDQSFKDFASKFSVNTPILEVYDIYSKVNNPKQNTPKKPIGSVKTTVPNNEVKNFYTSNEFDQIVSSNPEMLDDPKFMEVIRESMLKW